MFAIKHLVKSSFNITCLRKMRQFKRYSSFQFLEERENSDQLNALLEKYEKDLLYNSIIESKQLHLGYKQNNIVLAKHVRYKEKLNIALQRIQPVPVSLKYYSENDSCDINRLEGECLEGDQISLDIHDNQFPFSGNSEPVQEVHVHEKPHCSVKSEILSRKELIKKDMKNWMNNYDNYEYDLVEQDKRYETKDNWEINYGTPDPNLHISKYPCGGCGAHLHCKDTAIPGYIPSEIFKNCFDPNGTTLKSILCQRCYFLKEYNVALQVRVSPDDYPKILKSIPLTSSLVVLLVDLTDLPCSIWPGIADILGSQVPLVVVGNKIDLLPRDDKGEYLNRIKQILFDNVKLCGFASANIRHVELVSSKTGYGIERLITSLQKLWNRKGDVYVVGCTNVGKSTLFNILLQSDFCKINAADLIQRATTSPWPGTTLNLLKFPICRLSGIQSQLRYQRLKQLNLIERKEQAFKRNIDSSNSAKHASLIGRIDRSLTKSVKSLPLDGFSVQSNSNLTGRVSLGIDEKHSDFLMSKWCYDTPGVVHPDQIIHLLNTEELVKTLPRSLIRPQTFCIKPGTSLFIGGLARLDYISGPNSIRLTVFRAKELPITICNSSKADNIYNDLLANNLLAVPINEGDRLKSWPGLALSKTFQLSGKSVTESSYDIVLSNAGWIAVNCGLDKYDFQVSTPEMRGIYIRNCLLPKAVTLRGARIRYTVAYKKHKFIL